ncbi:Target of rapamycin complex 2 subunit AVO2 [Eumeta japonica]|uniref:Target of rapamycin complex 2 subunit AVO2 n=1 Tax=Eumeta variegata TaxID=151549 RepID=A0A4C1V5H5_EUMVA|nr:Target of rapamycin complex 2 subunit AVO2 [Eumeta japonica]
MHRIIDSSQTNSHRNSVGGFRFLSEYAPLEGFSSCLLIHRNNININNSMSKVLPTRRLLDGSSHAELRQWVRGGASSRLERAVLAGQGRRLLAAAEALPVSRRLPALLAKCDALHAAVEKGSLLELQELLEPEYNKNKYVLCLDDAGVGLLHKCIFYDYMDIAKWLVQNFPQTVHQRDSLGRTPLHYVCMCRDEAGAAALLEGAGARAGARDAAGRTPAHYRARAPAPARGPARRRPLIALPTREEADMPRDANAIVNRAIEGMVQFTTDWTIGWTDWTIGWTDWIDTTRRCSHVKNNFDKFICTVTDGIPTVVRSAAVGPEFTGYGPERPWTK